MRQRPDCSAGCLGQTEPVKGCGHSSKSVHPPSRAARSFMTLPRIALIVSEYHAFVTDGLEAGARAALAEAGWADDGIETLLVPGAFELPQAAKRAAETGRFSAVV